MGAALAFYSLLSLSPALILIVAVLSVLFSKKAVQQEVVFDIALFMDQKSAAAIQGLMDIAGKPSNGFIATVLGVGATLFGASAVFSELRDGLNRVWDVAPRPFGVRQMIHERLFSFALVGAVGILIALSLMVASTVTAIHHLLGATAPVPVLLIEIANFLISFGASTIIFLLVFRFVPDIALPWRTLMTGAIVSAIFFTIGKAVLGLYFTWAAVGSAYGAAGSVVAILVWAYYSAQIFYLGAEFTCVCGRASKKF